MAVPGLPDTKPEGAVEVTSPMSGIDFDFIARTYTIRFGEGESITVGASDVPEAGMILILAADELAGHLSRNQLVWADPAIVAAALEEVEV